MKRIISGVLALGVCLTPLTVPLMVRPSWGQSENLEEEINTLLKEGRHRTQQEQHLQAIEIFKQVLSIAKRIKFRQLEATALIGIGDNYDKLGEQMLALENYNQALLIAKEIKNIFIETSILNSIGSVYKTLGNNQQALEYLEEAMPLADELLITVSPYLALYIQSNYEKIEEFLDHSTDGKPSPREVIKLYIITLNNLYSVYNKLDENQLVWRYLNNTLFLAEFIGDRKGQAAILSNIARVYSERGERQQALEYYKRALSLLEAVGDRAGQAATLSNLAAIYRDTNQPTKAIAKLEQAVKIILKLRKGLLRNNRQSFLQKEQGTPIALISLLIDQNQLEKAFQHANRFTTADLADYTRLINAKVSNPQAQQLIDQWNQKNDQIQSLYQQNDSKPSDQLSQQLNAFQAENNKLGEDISRQFPEVAELFETTPTDIEKLRSSIPAGTVVIQPVLLTNIKNVPNTVAIFILTKDQLSVIKKPIDATEFDKLITEYREQLQNSGDANYIETSGKLYDILIRPVEDKIKAFSPKQLSIIATGKLRYIPFETLYDEQTDQYLIQKYPINYLTRLSSRSLKSNGETINQTSLQKGILALGNPIPRAPQNLPGTEEEVRNIAQIFPGSESFLHNDATLDKFKAFAPRFPFLHLATHGCFQPQGCQKLGMEANTILFADQQLNIADAALLGLQNTELLTLSACQTALQANSNGEEIAGLAYIFERAGAKAVMASLWNAEDNTTKEIMIQFYQNIKNGMSKGEALQKAKISQIGRHPFYWSPFILIGDAR